MTTMDNPRIASIMRVFLSPRLPRASTPCTICVTSGTGRRRQRRLPNPLLREMTSERAALALRALHVEPAAVPLQRMLDDGEPQPRAALAAGAARVHAVEPLRQARDMFRRDADAAVDHREIRPVRIGPPAHPHRALRH